jgi:hypothetical protein
MFRRVAIFRFDPFGFSERKNSFGNVLLICNDGVGGGGGGRDLVLQIVGFFFGSASMENSCQKTYTE